MIKGMTSAPRSVLGELTYGSDVTLRNVASMPGLEVAELERCGRRVAVFSTAHSGLAVGVRVELPRGAELAGASLDSDCAALMLGHLTAALQAHGHQAQLLAGFEGIEAVMLTSHVHAPDGHAITRRIAELSALAEALTPALEARGPQLLQEIRRAVGVRVSAAQQNLAPAPAAIVPTFDEAARNEMMRRLQGTPGAYPGPIPGAPGGTGC